MNRNAIEPGFVFGTRYRTIARLGEGGSGEVFLAVDSEDRRRCAVKALWTHVADRASMQARFLEEARIMRTLSHPHILQVWDIGTVHDPVRDVERVYFVTEYAPGGTVPDWLDTHPTPQEERCRLLLPVINALAYAHGRGVIHRDIKPRNLLVAADQKIKLCDFGVAKDTDQALNLTATGDRFGSLGYAAPEQLNDPRNAGVRSDIYAMGATLFALLTKPKQAPLDLHDPRFESRSWPISPSVLEVIIRACKPKPEQRFQTATALGDALSEALKEGGWPA